MADLAGDEQIVRNLAGHGLADVVALLDHRRDEVGLCGQPGKEQERIDGVRVAFNKGREKVRLWVQGSDETDTVRASSRETVYPPVLR